MHYYMCTLLQCLRVSLGEIKVLQTPTTPYSVGWWLSIWSLFTKVKAPFKSHQWIKNVKYMFCCLQNERHELMVSTTLERREREGRGNKCNIRLHVRLPLFSLFSPSLFILQHQIGWAQRVSCYTRLATDPHPIRNQSWWGGWWGVIHMKKRIKDITGVKMNWTVLTPACVHMHTPESKSGVQLSTTISSHTIKCILLQRAIADNNWYSCKSWS